MPPKRKGSRRNRYAPMSLITRLRREGECVKSCGREDRRHVAVRERGETGRTGQKAKGKRQKALVFLGRLAPRTGRLLLLATLPLRLRLTLFHNVSVVHLAEVPAWLEHNPIPLPT
jgi:hypothetical protein